MYLQFMILLKQREISMLMQSSNIIKSSGDADEAVAKMYLESENDPPQRRIM